MSDQQTHQDEEYVLAPRKRLKLSRMRKGVIGAMLVGAVAALAGTGTFASFSATTTNDATFKTIRLALKNQTSSTLCMSPSASVGSATIDANIDTNDASGCGALFASGLTAGVAITATVDITNSGDAAGNVYVFAPAACTVAASNTGFNTGSGTHGTDGALCGRVTMSIHNDSDNSCVYPATGAGACAALGQTATSTFTDFATTAPFASKLTAVSNLAANGTKTYTITVRMIRTQGDTTPACSGDANNDGFVDATGVGCDNKYMNEKATLNLRWLMQA